MVQEVTIFFFYLLTSRILIAIPTLLSATIVVGSHYSFSAGVFRLFEKKVKESKS